MTEPEKEKSALKQKMEKKKIKKKQKKAEHTYEDQNFDDKPPVWEEAKTEAMNVYQMITKNTEVIKVGYAAYQKALEIDPVERTDTIKGVIEKLPSELAILSKDIKEFLGRWEELSTPMAGKEGLVDPNEVPTFYAIFDNIVRLGLDQINVLTSRAADITILVSDLVPESKEMESEDNVE